MADDKVRGEDDKVAKRQSEYNYGRDNGLAESVGAVTKNWKIFWERSVGSIRDGREGVTGSDLPGVGTAVEVTAKYVPRFRSYGGVTCNGTATWNGFHFPRKMLLCLW